MRGAWCTALLAIGASACRGSSPAAAPPGGSAGSAGAATGDNGDAALAIVALTAPDAGALDAAAPAAVGPAPGHVDDELIKAYLDRATRHDAVQGAWVIEHHDGLMAVEIDGKRASLWDGRTLTEATIGTDDPGDVTFWIPDGPERGAMTGFASGYAYARVDGAEQLALGTIGERIGRGAIVVTRGAVFALDDAGHCTKNVAWMWVLDHPVRIETSPTKCAFVDDETFSFQENISGDEGRFTVLSVSSHRIGAVRSIDELHARGLGRHPDFATARAIVDADAIANDPMLIGRAAGGVVGDTSTVPGLVATYGKDPDRLDGKRVRTAGVVIAREAWTASGGDDATDAFGVDLTIAAPDHRDKPTVACTLRGRAPGTAIGDRVRLRGRIRVRGTVAPWSKRPGAEPALDDCTLVP